MAPVHTATPLRGFFFPLQFSYEPRKSEQIHRQFTMPEIRHEPVKTILRQNHLNMTRHLGNDCPARLCEPGESKTRRFHKLSVSCVHWICLSGNIPVNVKHKFGHCPARTVKERLKPTPVLLLFLFYPLLSSLNCPDFESKKVKFKYSPISPADLIFNKPQKPFYCHGMPDEARHNHSLRGFQN